MNDHRVNDFLFLSISVFLTIFINAWNNQEWSFNENLIDLILLNWLITRYYVFLIYSEIYSLIYLFFHWIDWFWSFDFDWSVALHWSIWIYSCWWCTDSWCERYLGGGSWNYSNMNFMMIIVIKYMHLHKHKQTKNFN